MTERPVLDPRRIHEKLARHSPPPAARPDISVVAPVNAQGDLENVLNLLADVGDYEGTASLEVILVVNNFPPDAPPDLTRLEATGVSILSIPDVRRPGEAVGFSARVPGVKAAGSETVVLFDADCRIPDSTALLDWYRSVLEGGAQAAYTHVSYHDFEDSIAIRCRFAIHHAARWVKRVLLSIPTTRGSNYAVNRGAFLEMYAAGFLADEMNVGPVLKQMKGRVVYSGRRRRRVLTSGRMFRPGWKRIIPYFWYRLKYNLRVLRVRAGIAGVTGRESDPVRRYVDNRPIRR